jgi:hypothetical protein
MPDVNHISNTDLHIGMLEKRWDREKWLLANPWKRFIDRLRKNTSIFRGQWEPRGMLPCCVEEASL